MDALSNWRRRILLGALLTARPRLLAMRPAVTRTHRGYARVAVLHKNLRRPAGSPPAGGGRCL